MYSFLFYAATGRQDCVQHVARARDVTRRMMPALGCSIALRERVLAEFGGGWFYFYPEELADRPLITECVDDALAVLAFGDMVAATRQGAAAVIAAAWREGGVEAVRRLDGCFGAVVVDRVARSVHIVSDLMGLRTLRHFCDGEVLLVSPHDVPIVATGLCPVEYDLASAASIVACDWSLGGKALLKHLTVGDPNAYTVWKDRAARTVVRPVIGADGRIEAGDREAVRRNIDEMIERMRENARAMSGDAAVVQAELTAGIDSRAVMGILLWVVGPSRIEAVTGGAPGHYDVKMAMRLAAAYGFRHRYFTSGKQVVNSFMPLSRLLAFVTNGTTNSKRATFSMPRPTEAATPTFVGNGGEIFHGFYAPSPLRRPRLSDYTSEQLAGYLERKLPRIRGLAWADGGMADELVGRLRDSVEAARAISGAPSDVLDLFYLHERYCRWGSGSARRTYVRDRYALFQSPGLLQLAWRLPAPISQNGLLHRTIIKRTMPRAYRWLINRRKYLPLSDYPRLSKAFSEAMIRLTGGADRVRRRFLGRAGTTTYQDAIGDVFAVQLGGVLRDMLLAEDSISLEILGRKGTASMLDEHISGRGNHIQAIGFLVTLQQYRKVIGEACEGAK